MKYLILFLIFVSQFAFGQDKKYVYPDSPFSNLHILDVMDNYIYTFGTCNTLMISPDDGESWATYESPIGDMLKDIDILPNTNGKKAIMLSPQLIIVFDSETNTFQTISDDNLSLSAGKFKSLFIKGNTIYVISNKSIHKSTIGVYDWERSTKLDLGNDYIYSYDITENHIWIGTSEGKIIKISLADDNATNVNDMGGRIRNLEMVNDDLGYIISSSKYNIQKTTNGAVDFSPLNGMPEAISPVAWGDKTILSINTNRIYASFDGGNTSTRYPTPNDGYTNLISGYKMTEAGVLYLVGKATMIMKSNDFGKNYIHLNKIKRENLQSICFNEKGEGYAIGGYSSFFRTKDFGKNWNLVDLNLSSSETFINTIEPIGQNRFLLGHQRGTSIIENGTVVQTDSVPCEKIMKSQVSNFIFASRRIGNEYIISKSEDNGDTWTDLITAPEFVSDIDESNTGKIFFTGENNSLIISEDNGINWKIQEVQGIDKKIKKIDFLDDNFGIISTGLGLFLTKDGGKTANTIKTGYALFNLHMITKTHIFCTSISNQRTTIYESVDQGKSWKTTNSFCARALETFYDKKNTIWLALEGGHIAKHTIMETSFSPEVLSDSTINIFPNPVIQGDILHFDKQFQKNVSVQIIELHSGKTVVKTNKLKSGKLCTKDIFPGTYLIKIIDEDKVYLNKLLVR